VILRQGELEPDYGRAVAIRGVRTTLTNSAVVAYYLHDPKPVLDRPVKRRPRARGKHEAPRRGRRRRQLRRGQGRVVARVADRIVVRVVR
jgi:hypothetical protein